MQINADNCCYCKCYTPSKRLNKNYEYSLAIEKCQKRLERLRSQQDFITGKKNYMDNLWDYYSHIWPARKIVHPNPMLYAYQFVPPPLPKICSKPRQTLPVQYEELHYAERSPQPGSLIPGNASYYTGDEIRMINEGLNHIDKHFGYYK